MNTRVCMEQRTSIQRYTSTSDGGGGYTKTWTDIAENLPCRAYAMRARVSGITGAIGGELVAQPWDVRVRELIAALLPRSADVHEGDQLGDITDRQGRLVYHGPLHVDSVGEYADHIRVTTRRID